MRKVIHISAVDDAALIIAIQAWITATAPTAEISCMSTALTGFGVYIIYWEV